MISRRALFGIGAGAATAALVPAPAKPDVVVGIDFGKDAMTVFSQSVPEEWKTFYPSRTLKWWHERMVLDSEFTNVEPAYVGCDCYPWPGEGPYCGAKPQPPH